MILLIVKALCYIASAVMIGALAAALTGRAANHSKGG